VSGRRSVRMPGSRQLDRGFSAEDLYPSRVVDSRLADVPGVRSRG
jgi:hypothetical protein